MDLTKNIFIVVVVAGAFYFVKNIKVSVSGAEARSSRAEFYDGEATSEPIEERERPRPDVKTVNRERASQPQSPPSDHQKLLEFVNKRDLCGFEKYAKDVAFPQSNRLEVLGMALGDRFKELKVFADPDIKNFENYKSVEAKSYMLGKARSVFEVGGWRQLGEYSKGMKEEDTKILEKVEQLAKKDPGNLFYAALRTDVYMRYKDVDEDIKQKIFEKNYASSRYENPAHTWLKDLYTAAKDNVVLFHLAQKVFENDVSTETGFLGRAIWMVYDENLRYHINGILEKALDGTIKSKKVYGYEVGVYNAYRNSLHYTDYEVTPDSDVFEKGKLQPTYEIGDLKLDLSKGCDSNKVTELEIKLRAL